MKNENILGDTLVSNSGYEYKVSAVADAICSNLMLLDLLSSFFILCENGSINNDPNSKDAKKLFALYNGLRLATSKALDVLDEYDKRRH